MKDVIMKIQGFLCYLTFIFSNAVSLDRVVKECIRRNGVSAPRKKFMVILVGMSKSGKTWLVEHSPILNSFFKIQTNLVHKLLRQKFSVFRDETVGTSTYWLFQYLTKYIESRVLQAALEESFAVVIDGCNLAEKQRSIWRALALQHGYKTMIILLDCPSDTLHERIAQAASEQEAAGRAVTWLDVYRQQKLNFVLPKPAESDFRMLLSSESIPMRSIGQELWMILQTC